MLFRSSIQREAGSAPCAPGHLKDDRVIAAALAILAWNDQVRTKLMSQGLLWTNEEQRKIDENLGATQIAGPRLVRQYLRDIGVLHSKNEATSTVKISRNRQITRT